jgi:nitric oxide reductase NorQ protein
MTEGKIEENLAARLVRLAGMTRSLKESGLAEGASTRLLIQAAQLLRQGLDIRSACRAGIIESLTDDPELLEAMEEMVQSIF